MLVHPVCVSVCVCVCIYIYIYIQDVEAKHTDRKWKCNTLEENVDFNSSPLCAWGLLLHPLFRSLCPNVIIWYNPATLLVCLIFNHFVVVMPRTILPQRNRRRALSATSTRKPEEEKDARGVTYFMEENVISPREVARFNEHIRN